MKPIFDKTGRKRKTVPSTILDELEDTITTSKENTMDKQKIVQKLIKISKELESASVNGEDAYDWQNAFSYKTGGHIGSRGVVQSLYDAGYTEEQVKKIFHSKVVRLFYDANEEKIETYIEKIFTAFIEKNKKQIDKMIE